MDQGKHIQATEAFKKSIELDPESTAAYLGLGRSYRDQDKYAQAEENFKQAIELNLKDDEVCGALAILYKEMNKQELSEQYFKKANQVRLKYPNPTTDRNYRKLKEILDKRKIRLVCVQYPMRSVESLKKILQDQKKGIIFVDNEKLFKEAVGKVSYKEYFVDIRGGDFGHCTRKGNRLLAENVANAILKEVFGR